MYIKIEIEDLQAFADVASLVDKPDFLEDIILVRNKFEIGPEKQMDNWEARLENTYNPSDRKKVSKELKEAQNYPTEYYKRIASAYRKYNSLEDFHYTVIDLRKKYRKPQYFEGIIKIAVTEGVVKEDDYMPGLATPLGMFLSVYGGTDIQAVPSDNEVVIVVYPNTKKADLLRMWQLSRSWIDEKTLNSFKKIKSQLKIHRNIYWFYKENKLKERENKDWDDIVEEWKEQCGVYEQGNVHPENQSCMYCDYAPDEKTFRDAIKAYEKWLQEVR